VIILKEFILFPELIFLIQDNFIDFINFLFPNIGHTGIELIPGSFKLIEFFLELFSKSIVVPRCDYEWRFVLRVFLRRSFYCSSSRTRVVKSTTFINLILGYKIYSFYRKFKSYRKFESLHLYSLIST
jgi:hypothetical protein